MAVKPNIEVAQKHMDIARSIMDGGIASLENVASNHLQAARAALKGSSKVCLEYYKALVNIFGFKDESAAWESSLHIPASTPTQFVYILEGAGRAQAIFSKAPSKAQIEEELQVEIDNDTFSKLFSGEAVVISSHPHYLVGMYVTDGTYTDMQLPIT